MANREVILAKLKLDGAKLAAAELRALNKAFEETQAAAKKTNAIVNQAFGHLRSLAVPSKQNLAVQPPGSGFTPHTSFGRTSDQLIGQSRAGVQGSMTPAQLGMTMRPMLDPSIAQRAAASTAASAQVAAAKAADAAKVAHSKSIRSELDAIIRASEGVDPASAAGRASGTRGRSPAADRFNRQADAELERSGALLSPDERKARDREIRNDRAADAKIVARQNREREKAQRDMERAAERERRAEERAAERAYNRKISAISGSRGIGGMMASAAGLGQGKWGLSTPIAAMLGANIGQHRQSFAESLQGFGGGGGLKGKLNKGLLIGGSAAIAGAKGLFVAVEAAWKSTVRNIRMVGRGLWRFLKLGFRTVAGAAKMAFATVKSAVTLPIRALGRFFYVLTRIRHMFWNITFLAGMFAGAMYAVKKALEPAAQTEVWRKQFAFMLGDKTASTPEQREESGRTSGNARFRWLAKQAEWLKGSRTEIVEAGRMMTQFGVFSRSSFIKAADAAVAYKKSLEQVMRALGYLVGGRYGTAMRTLMYMGITKSRMKAEGIGFSGAAPTGTPEDQVAAVMRIWDRIAGGMNRVMSKSLQVAITNLGVAFENFRSQAFEGAVPWATQIVNIFRDALSSAGDKLAGRNWDKLGQGVVTAIRRAFAAVSMGKDLFKGWREALSDIMNGAGVTLTSAADKIGDAFVTHGPRIYDWITTAFKAGSEAFSMYFNAALGNLEPFVRRAFDSLGTWLYSIIPGQGGKAIKEAKDKYAIFTGDEPTNVKIRNEIDKARIRAAIKATEVTDATGMLSLDPAGAISDAGKKRKQGIDPRILALEIEGGKHPDLALDYGQALAKEMLVAKRNIADDADMSRRYFGLLNMKFATLSGVVEKVTEVFNEMHAAVKAKADADEAGGKKGLWEVTKGAWTDFNEGLQWQADVNESESAFARKRAAIEDKMIAGTAARHALKVSGMSRRDLLSRSAFGAAHDRGIAGTDPDTPARAAKVLKEVTDAFRLKIEKENVGVPGWTRTGGAVDAEAARRAAEQIRLDKDTRERTELYREQGFIPIESSVMNREDQQRMEQEKAKRDEELKEQLRMLREIDRPIFEEIRNNTAAIFKALDVEVA